MLVRIRFGKGPKVAKKRRKNQRLAQMAAAMLTPAALAALALGLWRLAADLNWTSAFVIPDGLFSHWLVWVVAAILLQLCAHLLNRYGKA